ncbi:MAG: carbohydrate-binding domain-containing protein [Ruminococcus sp.]|jgi:hypothetical protein|nr:carbohydrate-binding domain-containing protein [Ruminococcus sp.]
MKKQFTLILSSSISLILMMFALSGCNGENQVGANVNSDATISNLKITNASSAAEMVQSTVMDGTDALIKTVSTNFSDRDISGEYDTNVVEVDLNSLGSDYEIKSAGTYVLSGTLTGYQIRVEITDTEKAQIVLKNAHITSSDGPAIYILSGDKTFVTLADGTENSLTDTEKYTLTDGDEPNACLFSKSDLTINGTGKLTVNGNYNHGIYSKDDISLASGNLNVTAVNDAIKGKDFVQIAGGTYKLNAGSDGLVSSNITDTALGYIVIEDGTFDITAGNDGIQAETVLQIENGVFNINSGGGSANASYTSEGNMNEDWGAWGGGRGGMFPGGEMFSDGERPNRGQMPGGTMPNGEMPQSPNGEFPGGFDPRTQTPNGNSAVASGAISVSATVANGVANSTTADSTTTSNSAKGLKAGAGLLIMSGTFTLDTSDDAIHTNGDLGIVGGKFDMSSGDDGIHADDACVILDGKVNIAKSYEAIEGNSITIAGGEFDITAADDGFNAAGGNDSSAVGGRPGQGNFDTSTSSYLRFTSGKVNLDASGDGLDSNGYLYVDGGEIFVSGPENSGNGAMDYGIEAKITGGTVVAAGSSGMAQNFSDTSTQCSFLVNFNANISGGEKLIVTDSNGTEILSFTPEKAYQCAVISSPNLEKGKTYTVTAGSTTTDVTLENIITGGGGGMFGGFGMR